MTFTGASIACQFYYSSGTAINGIDSSRGHGRPLGNTLAVIVAPLAMEAIAGDALRVFTVPAVGEPVEVLPNLKLTVVVAEVALSCRLFLPQVRPHLLHAHVFSASVLTRAPPLGQRGLSSCFRVPAPGIAVFAFGILAPGVPQGGSAGCFPKCLFVDLYIILGSAGT